MNAPRKVTYLIALIIGVLGIVASFISIPFVSAYAFWFVVVGYVVLLVACLIKGL